MSDNKKNTNKVHIQVIHENAATIYNTPASTEDPDQQPDEDAIKLLEAEQKAAENHDRFLRLAAQFENYKKRTARETADFRKFANEALLKELLLVVDNLERAIESARAGEGSIQSLLQGVEMTRNEILKVFDKFGAVPITAMGETFDPNFHQAVARETTKDHPENTVVKELQKGYMLHDRLLRPSMVIVSKPGPNAGENT
jgi:molecular chaperone GrpE